MSKSAMQELKEYLDEYRFWDASLVFGKIEELLEKEKHQIVYAYELGSIEEMKETFKTGKEFYESVYENPNE